MTFANGCRQAISNLLNLSPKQAAELYRDFIPDITVEDAVQLHTLWKKTTRDSFSRTSWGEYTAALDSIKQKYKREM